MNARFRLFLVLLWAGFFLASCQPSTSGKKPPQAVDGVLDLSAWDFEKDGLVKLDGEWEFYWEQLLEPAE